jgi:hypothetical protein
MVDADPNKTARLSVFGKMNESFDDEKYNAELGEDGFIRVLRDCCDEELFTKYGSKYNWDALKERALRRLVDDVNERFPTMRGHIIRSWGAIMESTCSLDTWVRRLIEGRCANNELHGIAINEQNDQEVEMGEIERMVLFLTYGPNSKRYNFKNLENVVHETVVERGTVRSKYGREVKTSLAKFTTYDGQNVTSGDPETIVSCDEGNSRILELMSRIKKSLNVVRESPPALQIPL